MPVQIGQRLGQYEITGQLGQGGMATVYRARQLNIARDVAIKVIRADLVASGDFLSRFEREAQTIATFSHPHILKLFDYGQQDGIAYLVTELLAGGTLQNRLLNGAFSPEVAGRLLDQIASALHYAHQRGVIHRDLKPQNILLDSDQNAILTDFGIAKLLHETTGHTEAGIVVGTPAYIAPEQWRAQPAEARTDVYALGIVLFEILTGKLPFSADTSHAYMYKHLYEQPPSVLHIKPDLTPNIALVLDKALAKNPAQRFESALALASAYGKALREKAHGPSVVLNPGRARDGSHEQSAPLVAESPTIVDAAPDSTIRVPRLLEARRLTTALDAATIAGILLFGASAIQIAGSLIAILHTGDLGLMPMGIGISLAALAVVALPLVGRQIIARRFARFPGPRMVPVALQLLIFLLILVAAAPFTNTVADDLVENLHTAVSSGNGSTSSKLLWELAELNPQQAAKLAGQFNDSGVNALVNNNLTQARLYLQAIQRLDDDPSLDVGRSKTSKSTSRYNLAQLREQEANPQAAIVAYREALNFDDTNFQAAYGLSSLLLIDYDSSKDARTLDEAVSVAHSSWANYLPESVCIGKQDLAVEDSFQKIWHCFALKTTEAGARLKRSNLDKGDTSAVIETLARSAINLAQANDNFHIRPGYFTAEAYYYLAKVTEPNIEIDTLCGLLRNYDDTNARHHAWAEYADKALAGRSCPAQ